MPVTHHRDEMFFGTPGRLDFLRVSAVAPLKAMRRRNILRALECRAGDFKVRTTAHAQQKPAGFKRQARGASDAHLSVHPAREDHAAAGN